MTKTLYVAGPMTGLPQFNIPAFDRMTDRLRRLGHTVISPAELDSEDVRAELLASPDGRYEFGGAITQDGSTWADFLARDVKLIADQIDEIVVLPDWWRSRGARLEVFVGLLSRKPIHGVDEERGLLKQIPDSEVLDYIRKGFGL